MKKYDLIEGFKKFLEDVIDTLSTAESLILRLKTENSKDSQRKLFQMFHSIKGSSGTYGLREFETYVHKMEDTLNILAAGGLSQDESISDLLEQLDSLHHKAENYQSKSDEAILKIVDPDGSETADPCEIEINTKTARHEDSPNKKILIICDSKVVSTVIIQTLYPYNLACSLVEDGHSALGRLLLEPFDMIISQVQLKLIDGISLGKMLQLSTNPNQSTPILFISGSEPSNEIDKHQKKNWRCIAKGPELPNQLIEQLQSFFELEKRKTVEPFVTNLRNIALIDDRENIHTIIDLCFPREKTNVVHIIDPIKGLKNLKQNPLDVILLDYRLGEVTGIQVLQNIRGMGIATPVIFLTYTTDAEVIANLLKQDVIGLIRKPFSPKKLPLQVMEMLSLRNKRTA